MHPARQSVPAPLIEHLVLQEMRRTAICQQIVAVTVASAEGEGNWIVQSFDSGPHPIQDCRRAFSLILPDLQARFALARD